MLRVTHSIASNWRSLSVRSAILAKEFRLIAKNAGSVLESTPAWFAIFLTMTISHSITVIHAVFVAWVERIVSFTVRFATCVYPCNSKLKAIGVSRMSAGRIAQYVWTIFITAEYHAIFPLVVTCFTGRALNSCLYLATMPVQHVNSQCLTWSSYGTILTMRSQWHQCLRNTRTFSLISCVKIVMRWASIRRWSNLLDSFLHF